MCPPRTTTTSNSLCTGSCRVQGLDTNFRASKKNLEKRGNFDPSWGPGCNPVLLQLLQTVFRVAARASLHLSCSGAEDPGVPPSAESSEEDCSDHVEGRKRGRSSENSDIRRAQEEASKDRAKAADLQKKLAEVTTEKVTAQRKATFHEHICGKLQAFQPSLESKDLLGLAAQGKDLERDLETMKAT